jgi:hypothetical protein
MKLKFYGGSPPYDMASGVPLVREGHQFLELRMAAALASLPSRVIFSGAP